MDNLIERAREAAQHSREFGPGTNAPLLDALADALEAAREDVAEAKQNGYELGLLAAAREASNG